MSLRHTLRDLFRTSHCLNARLCVQVNEARVLRAKADLADALDAMDRCNANARISGYTEPASVPASLVRR